MDGAAALRARCDELLEASLKHTHVWKESDEALRLRAFEAETDALRRKLAASSSARRSPRLSALASCPT